MSTGRKLCLVIPTLNGPNPVYFQGGELCNKKEFLVWLTAPKDHVPRGSCVCRSRNRPQRKLRPIEGARISNHFSET